MFRFVARSLCALSKWYGATRFCLTLARATSEVSRTPRPQAPALSDPSRPRHVAGTGKDVYMDFRPGAQGCFHHTTSKIVTLQWACRLPPVQKHCKPRHNQSSALQTPRAQQAQRKTRPELPRDFIQPNLGLGLGLGLHGTNREYFWHHGAAGGAGRKAAVGLGSPRF